MTTRTEVVALLADVNIDLTRPVDQWQRHDGTPLTAAEATVVGSATWAEIEAARDLLVLDVQLEGGTA